MEPLKIEISSSATLWAIKTDKFKKNLLSMSLFLPIGQETTPLDLLFPGILLRGVERYPTNARVKRRLEELYAARIGMSGGYYGDSLVMGYLADFLDEGAVSCDFSIFRGVVELLSDIWHRPATDPTGLLREGEARLAKNSQIDIIKSEINNTSLYATNRARELVCGGEPYGFSVTEEHVSGVTAERLTERWHEVRDSSHINFFYVGAKDGAEVAEVLADAFPPAKSCRAKRPTPDIRATKPGMVVEQESRMPVTQGKLVMGFTAGQVVMSDTPEYYAMCLFSEVFGGTPSSKLFVNLRERLSLCYYCGSYYENYKGIIYVSSGIDGSAKEAARAEILAQLEDMKKGRITKTELDTALLSMKNSYRQIEDSPYSIISFCFGRASLGLDCSAERFIKRIGEVSVADIARAAQLVELRALYFLAGEGGEEA